MSRKMMMLVAFASLVAGCFTLPTKAQEAAYTATLQNKGNPGEGGSQIQFTFRITKWSTQDEIKRLGAILKEKGEQRFLLDEMKKLDAGRINKTGESDRHR